MKQLSAQQMEEINGGGLACAAGLIGGTLLCGAIGGVLFCNFQ